MTSCFLISYFVLVATFFSKLLKPVLRFSRCIFIAMDHNCDIKMLDESANKCEVNGIILDSKGVNKEIEKQETEHFEAIVNVFRYYRLHSRLVLRKELENFKKLPHHQRVLIQTSFLMHADEKHKCIDKNQALINDILIGIGHLFDNNDLGHAMEKNPHILRSSAADMEKLHSTLKQIMRDWSEEGKVERDQSYEPVLDALRRYFPESADSPRKDHKILVPGAGLGRLLYEVVSLGFSCDGNEFSLFMLFCSNYILNRCRELNCCTVYPYIHENSNNMTYEDMVRPVPFPDLVIPRRFNDFNCPSFSMIAGDFLEVFEDECEVYDAIATVYFIDTARNVFDYIEQIIKLLKPGGIWINLGPLLYHFAKSPNEDSIELPYEEILRIAKMYGLEFLEERTQLPSNYAQNSKSMLVYHYKCAFFVCRKPKAVENFQ